MRAEDVRVLEHTEVGLLPLPQQDSHADLETVFVEQLESFVFSPGAVADHLAQIDTVLGEKRSPIDSLSREAEAVRAEQEKLYRLYLDGGLSAGAFRERDDPLEARKEQLSAEIPRLQGEVDFLAIRYLSSAQVLSEAQTLCSSWSALSFDARRPVARRPFSPDLLREL